jgi:PhoH-like ATPase
VKNFVLDTNVLLHNPKSILNFEDNHVHIPIEVIEEVDRFKRESSELGQNARAISRLLDELRTQGKLSSGVKLPNGGVLKIVTDPAPPKKPVTKTEAKAEAKAEANGHMTVDNLIIRRALDLKSASPKSTPTIIVSKDINLRIKADALGLQAEDYENDRVHLSDLYSGMRELVVGHDAVAKFRSHGELALPSGATYHANEYVSLIDEANPKKAALARVDATGQKALPILEVREGVWGIRPRNREQHFALDALLDDRIKLVTLMGKAGTGKTLIAMAAGLKRTVTDREFRRVVVARPTVSMGREIGFLPGSLDEKLGPWMQPIHDALELLSDLNMGHEHRRSADLMRSGVIVVEALSYIRGRSIANQFMIIDEAQNLTPLEVKTIVTRVGNGTKIIFTGDPYQIDNPYVDSQSNGFNYLISRFRGQPLAAHIELQKGERSELAEAAANLL